MESSSRFTAKILASRGKPTERVYFLRVTSPEEDRYFYFIKVDPAKEPDFLKAIEGSGAYKLKDFGDILASGQGEPSDEIKAKMQEQYPITYQEQGKA